MNADDALDLYEHPRPSPRQASRTDEVEPLVSRRVTDTLVCEIFAVAVCDAICET